MLFICFYFICVFARSFACVVCFYLYIQREGKKQTTILTETKNQELKKKEYKNVSGTSQHQQFKKKKKICFHSLEDCFK